jgi:hypothetical protein
MRKLFARFSLAVFCLLGSSCFAQAQNATTPRLPVSVDASFFKSLNAAPKHTASNKMSAATNAATKQQATRIVSVPTFSSSFTFQGTVFPFTMVGNPPQAGGTTEIPTSYVPISFFFDEFVDANGNNIVIDASALTHTLVESPEFDRFTYTTGNTQFTDAVQRAEFFNLIKHKDGDDSWHTLFNDPRMLIPVTVEVPVGSSVVFGLPDGSVVALIDINFLSSQLNTLLQTEGVRVTEVPIFLTHNAVYGDFLANQPQDCCIGGFHTAFESNQVGNKIFVQTFAFATWLDPDVSDFVFGDPTIFADIQALSHEIGELTNDPFVNNIVPNYQLPGAPAGACQNVLEVGDVIENLPNPDFPVTINGFTYHPQNLGLLQWFEGQTPSTAIGGAYSYPDTTKLTAPFTPCPTK